MAVRDSADGQVAQRGCSILVVEDDYIVAWDICSELNLQGLTVIGPAGSVRQALDLAKKGGPIHGALLDVNLGGEEVFPVADELSRRGIPFVFVTAYDASMLPQRYQANPRIEKPMVFSEIGALLNGMCPTI